MTGGSIPHLRADRHRVLVLALGFANIAASLGFTRFALTVIMPDMRHGLALSYTQMGVLVMAGFAVYMVANPLGGAIAVRFGPRRTIAASLAIVTAGFAGLALAPGFRTALGANLLMQLGSAAANAAGFTIAVAWFGPSRRGAATGIVLGGAGAGIVLVGQFVPHVLAASPAGWRAAWGALGAVTAVIAVACAALLPGRRLVPAVETDGTSGPPPSLLRDARLWALAGVVGTFGFQHMIYGTFFAAHLTATGWPIASAGRMWSLVGVLTIASGFVGGALSDRIGRFRALAVLLGGQAAATALLAWTVGEGAVLGSVLLYGGTLMGFPAVVSALCGDLRGGDAARALGTVNVLFSSGQMLGPLLAGMVMDATGTASPALALGAATATLGAAGALVAASRFPQKSVALERGRATRADT